MAPERFGWGEGYFELLEEAERKANYGERSSAAPKEVLSRLTDEGRAEVAVEALRGFEPLPPSCCSTWTHRFRS